jgi:hypothetical protein
MLTLSTTSGNPQADVIQSILQTSFTCHRPPRRPSCSDGTDLVVGVWRTAPDGMEILCSDSRQSFLSSISPFLLQTQDATTAQSFVFNTCEDMSTRYYCYAVYCTCCSPGNETSCTTEPLRPRSHSKFKRLLKALNKLTLRRPPSTDSEAVSLTPPTSDDNESTVSGSTSVEIEMEHRGLFFAARGMSHSFNSLFQKCRELVEVRCVFY